MSLEQNLKTIKDSELDIELLKRENEKECAERNGKIEKLQKVIEMVEEELETNLKESGEKKLECKLGYCSYRVMPDKWEYGEEAISEIHGLYPDDEGRYIKVTETLIKTNIREDVESGKFGLPSLTITPQEPKFNYKIK